MSRAKNDKAFTLIELLVVVMLIGILTGVMFRVMNFRGLQAKSRDAERIGDIKKIQGALEMRYLDFRNYPVSANWLLLNGTDALSVDLTTNRYLSEMPVDPVSSVGSDPCNVNSQGYFYRSTAGNSYEVAILVEEESSADDSRCENAATPFCVGVLRCYAGANP